MCWVVYDSGLAGLVVRKEETTKDTDAILSGNRILKICTFKVSDRHRGVRLGELLLKKTLWYAQSNSYDLVYLTIYKEHTELIDLLEYYGFQHTATRKDGERIYEKCMPAGRLEANNQDHFTVDRLNYPRFVTGPDVRAYCVPIQEQFHDALFPDLKDSQQANLFEGAGLGSGPMRSGNTIRKVYLCRANIRLAFPGSLLFFYKSKSELRPSQALTAVGIFEEAANATSTIELARLAGGRSVYNNRQLVEWAATSERPMTVINFLLAGYINPIITKEELEQLGVFGGQPPQSISRIQDEHLDGLLQRLNLGFDTSRK